MDARGAIRLAPHMLKETSCAIDNQNPVLSAITMCQNKPGVESTRSC